ncbi:MAG: glycoside hydrolase family 28 protein [Sphingobacteriaceae bacterium]
MKYTFTIAVCIASFIGCFNSYSQSPKPWPKKMPVVKAPEFKKDTINIVSYGAINDGVTLNTKSINNAITACSQKGGGVVVIPRGLWLTGPIELKNNVNLHLKSDALLSFTTDLSQYKLIQTNWEGLEAIRNQSPISGTNLVNIAITGKGIIDGNGDAWRMVKKEKLTESQWKNLIASGGALSDDKKIWYPTESSLKGSKVKKAGVIAGGKTAEDFAEIKDFLRPNMIVLTKCKNVLLEGVTFQNSPAWNIHPLMSENITIRNIYAKNPWYAQNGDGLDIESCNNVLVENSVFDVGDDGICIKSGRDAEGRKRAMPTQNVVIRNCVVYHAHGGFVIGSEMSGGANNIYVSDCTFIGTDIGLRFKTTRGRGGVVENIFIKNINMKDIVGEALLFDMYYAAVDPIPAAGEKRDAPKVQLLPVTEETPAFRNFYINNVVADGASKAIFIRGLPEMNINNIYLENMTLQADKGIEIEEAKEIHLKNINVISEQTKPVVKILNGSALTFNNLQYKQGAELLFNINGERSSNITVTNTNVSKAASKAEFNNDAKPRSLTIK